MRDLRQDPCPTLLADVHEHVMRRFFPMSEELDPLDVWRSQMNSPTGLHNITHIQLYFDASTTRAERDDYRNIAGVCVWDFLPNCNTGLLSYFCVTEVARGRKLSGIMIESAYQQYMARSDPSRTQIFLAETNKLGVHDGVLESAVRHKILHRLGFAWVQCMYVQPPLGEGKPPCADLLLLVYKPREEFIDASFLFAFVHDFWMAFVEEDDDESGVLLNSDMFREMQKNILLRKGGLVPIRRELPWDEEAMGMRYKSLSAGGARGKLYGKMRSKL